MNLLIFSTSYMNNPERYNPERHQSRSNIEIKHPARVSEVSQNKTSKSFSTQLSLVVVVVVYLMSTLSPLQVEEIF